MLEVVAEAKMSELNGSCPLNGSAVLVVGGAPELGGRGLAPEVAVVKGSLLKKSPSPPPPPVLAPPEPDVWREMGKLQLIMHIATIHDSVNFRILLKRKQMLV